jgi:hypothetical protein
MEIPGACIAWWALFPAAQLGLVVLTNLGGTMLPEALLWYLNDHYFDTPHRLE